MEDMADTEKVKMNVEFQMKFEGRDGLKFIALFATDVYQSAGLIQINSACNKTIVVGNKLHLSVDAGPRSSVLVRTCVSLLKD